MIPIKLTANFHPKIANFFDSIELFSSIFRQMENRPRRNEVTISVSTQLTYPLLITVHPVQHLYIGSEVVILFDDVRIPYIVKAEPVAESCSGIVAKAISQASDSRRRLRLTSFFRLEPEIFAASSRRNSCTAQEVIRPGIRWVSFRSGS